jgi:hypothetical protein
MIDFGVMHLGVLLSIDFPVVTSLNALANVGRLGSGLVLFKTKIDF